MPGTLGVIPARYASTRFPGKPLAPLGDKTIVEEIWVRASAAKRLDRVLVATEDERIVEACNRFGAEVMLTDAAHETGTDRVAEVVERVGNGYAIAVNIQGDEPLLTPTSLDDLIAAFDGDAGLRMATLAEPIADERELFDPNVVKLVTSDDGRALYFSRSPIPYHRGSSDKLDGNFRSALAKRTGGLTGYRKHQGIYAYTRETLLTLSRLEPSSLERDEGLEQLRALQAGVQIKVVDSDFRSQAVDTPEDLERVARILMEAP